MTSPSVPSFGSVGDGGMFNNGQAGNPQNTEDYKTWDWKTIKMAVVGAAAVDDSHQSQGATAEANISPASLQTAGNAFNKAQKYMHDVADNLRQQAEGLAGQGGALQGPGPRAVKRKKRE